MMLELIASGMRIGEVLKLRLKDINQSKLVINDPKSGKEYEYVFVPKRVTERDCVSMPSRSVRHRMIAYSPFPARLHELQLAEPANWSISLLNLMILEDTRQRMPADQGCPLKIVSKIILRHANLSTTQRYLGKISDAEKMRWIDNL